MDFTGSSVFIGPRDQVGPEGVLSWPAWSWAINADGPREEALTPVGSYAQAEALVGTVGAERLFVPADVLADMVRHGAGPS